jgi:hypothetical protein
MFSLVCEQAAAETTIEAMQRATTPAAACNHNPLFAGRPNALIKAEQRTSAQR